MATGRLKLRNGFSASCSYAVESPEGGTLALPSSLYLPPREHDEATLIQGDGAPQRRIAITFGPELGAATFVFLD